MADAPPSVDADGTVNYAPSIVVPFSPLASVEAKAEFADRTPKLPPDYFIGNPFSLDRIAGTRAWFDAGAETLAARLRETYPVEIVATQFGGVPAQVVTPAGGGRDAKRVLVNLHGGGFVFGTGLGVVEAIPVASLSGIKVITIDYRMGPEHQFPSASKDVATVFAALLEQHAAHDIGIYGCSAGGTLAMQAVAWFQAHGLPCPGAIGVACAAGIASPTAFPPGDSRYTSRLLAGAPMPRPEAIVPPALLQYYTLDDLAEPLASPAKFPDILAAFPPTLILSGTRDFALSGAVWTHSQLVRLKVDAALHVWEGVGHDLLYLPHVPEAREAYAVIASFFDTKLGQSGSA